MWWYTDAFIVYRQLPWINTRHIQKGDESELRYAAGGSVAMYIDELHCMHRFSFACMKFKTQDE